jgi:hypothetical protein
MGSWRCNPGSWTMEPGFAFAISPHSITAARELATYLIAVGNHSPRGKPPWAVAMNPNSPGQRNWVLRWSVHLRAYLFDKIDLLRYNPMA